MLRASNYYSFILRNISLREEKMSVDHGLNGQKPLHKNSRFYNTVKIQMEAQSRKSLRGGGGPVKGSSEEIIVDMKEQEKKIPSKKLELCNGRIQEQTGCKV